MNRIAGSRAAVLCFGEDGLRVGFCEGNRPSVHAHSACRVRTADGSNAGRDRTEHFAKGFQIRIRAEGKRIGQDLETVLHAFETVEEERKRWVGRARIAAELKRGGRAD